MEALSAVVAAVVDSRNVFHQCGDAIGLRARPSVPGIRTALRQYGLDAQIVHVGLALARPRDRVDLARYHASNDAYRSRVVADGGDPLLGELHRKPNRMVEEKMVDSACCVRITRYVEEIASNKAAVAGIVVLSKDIDLAPAVDYAVERKVPIVVAGLDVVQHRKHPYILLGPAAYAAMSGEASLKTGHEYRELLACALHDGTALSWTVGGTSKYPRLEHKAGILAVPAAGVALPPVGQSVSLHPVDVTWVDKMLGSFPVLVCAGAPSGQASWVTATVRRRTAPMTVEIKRSDGVTDRVQFVLGGVSPGDTVVAHKASGRIVGRLLSNNTAFDPNLVEPLRVTSVLPGGGALVANLAGTRGLLTTAQKLVAGQRVPGIQIDQKPRGPVWAAIGTPLL